jgi:hypothetical protein
MRALRTGMSKLQLRRERGQAFVLVALALPVFFVIAAVVVDGSLAFVEKRQMQTAADAAALAAAREVTPALTSCDAICMSTVRDKVAKTTADYSRDNHWPGLPAPTPLPACTQPSDTDCYTWPYNGSNGKVEVRLHTVVDGSFAKVAGLAPGFLKPNARAVASATSVAATHCVFNPPLPAGVDPDQYLPSCVIPGQPAQTGNYQAPMSAHCLFNPPLPAGVDPDQYLNTTPQPCTGPDIGGVDGAVALVMSRECDAISYTGSGGGTVGTLVTNGGMWFQGNAPKTVDQLAYDQPGCPGHPDHPPSGTSQCDPANNFLCAKVLYDFSARMPMNWPIPPPPEPTPVPSGAWNPTSDYPSKCIDLGAGNVTFAPGDGPAGIYCLQGGGKLTLSGDLTTGDGYTFFALGGGQIQVSSNGTKVKYYWPSGCGARPTSRTASFTCFGRTISGYDPQTLFYATSTVHDSNCDKNTICISGGNSSVDGDMFAVKPAVFPPPDRSP